MLDVVIVGGGPAGLNAALLLGRARRRVLVCDAGTPRNAPVAHLHGFLSRDGLPPAELRRIAREQLSAYSSVELRLIQVEAASTAGDGEGFVVVRTSRGTAPGAGVRPAELDLWLLTVADLAADAAVALGRRPASRTHRLVLAGDMQRYRWTINGRAHHHGPPLQVREGERVRLLFENRSPTWHPMHLHGHTFQLQRAANLGPGPRKDTVIVRPAERVAVEFDADNPGRWMVHCHNAYHQAAGMMTTLGYLS